MDIVRCRWVGKEPLNRVYHDREWGVPVHDDRKLFEMLVLEGAQAGLSWLTILKRRENYRRAFVDFEAARVARFSAAKLRSLMADEGIIRNRLKIEGAVRNAQAFLRVQEECSSFDAYLWRFVGGKPKNTGRKEQRDVPAFTDESIVLSKDLRRRGFTFVGPTICYAFMQAVGTVNDHTTDCYRHAVCAKKQYTRWSRL